MSEQSSPSPPQGGEGGANGGVFRYTEQCIDRFVTDAADNLPCVMVIVRDVSDSRRSGRETVEARNQLAATLDAPLADIAARLKGDEVQVRLIKDGDHRLSREADIAALIATIEELL